MKWTISIHLVILSMHQSKCKEKKYDNIFFLKNPALLLYEPQEGSRQTDRQTETSRLNSIFHAANLNAIYEWRTQIFKSWQIETFPKISLHKFYILGDRFYQALCGCHRETFFWKHAGRSVGKIKQTVCQSVIRLRLVVMRQRKGHIWKRPRPSKRLCPDLKVTMEPNSPLMRKCKSSKGHNQNIESEGGISSASGWRFPHTKKTWDNIFFSKFL